MHQNTDQATSPHRTTAWSTLPNVLCVVRLFGSLVLIPLAIQQQPLIFLAVYIALAATDWADGRLARWLDQRSMIGPTLDSVADVTMYSAMLFGICWMFTERLIDSGFFIAAAVISYGISCLVSIAKFRRLPSYHTRSAKFSWLLTFFGVTALCFQWNIWPVRIAALGVTLANIEAILITFVLQNPADDVKSLWEARARSV